MNSFRRNAIKYLTATLICSPALMSLPAQARKSKPRIYTSRFSDQALQGHDPVSYFTQNSPAKGSKKYTVSHQGAKWSFQNDENLQAFVLNPEKYMPQFGGYCAFSIAQGKVVKGDATLWKVIDGKLYVNFSKGIHNLWLKRTDKLIAKATANWPSILS